MKILIIKLGALGDVVRTLPILPAIKEKYPGAEISWVTKENALPLFEGNPYVEKVHYVPFVTDERYDVLYNFDIEDEATELAGIIRADKKFGFYKDGNYAAAFNLGSEYYLNTLFDDEVKKSNKKTYQEMMFDAGEFSYDGQHVGIFLSDLDKEIGKKFVSENGIDSEKLIGLHVGSSGRWPSKAWHPERVMEFIIKAKSRGLEILLLGGPEEVEKNEELISKLNGEGIKIFHKNTSNSFKEFASLVNVCSNIICGDSFALHVALALRKQTVALFFCNSPDEIEGYGLLKKIVSPKLEEFFPERMDEYDEELVKSISAEEVLSAVEGNYKKEGM
jgi:ADP-heptose:LPS heptosyltransferase